MDSVPAAWLTGRAFQGKKARVVNLPASINERYDAFCGVKTLEHVNIPSAVTQIKANAFCDCAALMELSIPATIACIEDRLGAPPFYGCGGAKRAGEYRYETVEIPPSVVSPCGSASETDTMMAMTLRFTMAMRLNSAIWRKSAFLNMPTVRLATGC